MPHLDKFTVCPSEGLDALLTRLSLQRVLHEKLFACSGVAIKALSRWHPLAQAGPAEEYSQVALHVWQASGRDAPGSASTA